MPAVPPCLLSNSFRKLANVPTGRRPRPHQLHPRFYLPPPLTSKTVTSTLRFPPTHTSDPPAVRKYSARTRRMAPKANKRAVPDSEIGEEGKTTVSGGSELGLVESSCLASHRVFKLDAQSRPRVSIVMQTRTWFDGLEQIFSEGRRRMHSARFSLVQPPRLRGSRVPFLSVESTLR